MNFKEMFDIVLALVLVYFALSLVSSSLSELLMNSLEIRGRTLQRYLRVGVGEKIADLLNLPQIRSLRPIRFRSWLSIFSGATEQKMVENIPVPILTDSFFDLMGLGKKSEYSVEQMATLIEYLPDSDGKSAMILWINQGITDITELRSKLELFFSGLLAQATATANANARSFVITLSVLVVLILGTDTITIARDLSVAPQMRALVAAQANFIVTSECGDAGLGDLVTQLDSMTIGYTWKQALRYLPSETNFLEWIQFAFLKIVGLAITVVFVSQGSGFWFDLLNKLK